jgi:hypothetical protein
VSSLLFDGRSFTDTDILPTLRRAAHDDVQSPERNMVLNPREWVSAFVDAVKRSPLRPALASAVEALVASGDDREVDLGSWIESNAGVSGNAAILANALAKQACARHLDTAQQLISGLYSAARAGTWKPDDRIRKHALDPDCLQLREQLLLQLGEYDRPWVIAHASELLGTNPDDAVVLAAYAATSMSGGELQSFITDLRAALDRAGNPTAKAVEAGLRQINR